jgi:hypothetical protein
MSDKEKTLEFNRFSSLGMNMPAGQYDTEWVREKFIEAGEKFIKAFDEDWDKESGIKVTIVAEYNGGPKDVELDEPSTEGSECTDETEGDTDGEADNSEGSVQGDEASTSGGI